MIAGWTIDAWLVVVIIPGFITVFSIIYYIMGIKNSDEYIDRKGDNE